MYDDGRHEGGVAREDVDDIDERGPWSSSDGEEEERLEAAYAYTELTAAELEEYIKAGRADTRSSK